MKIPRVTDHAILRYLERAKGFDVEAVRARIAALCTAGVAAGANCVRADGVKFLLTNEGTVTTATQNTPLPNNTSRQRLGVTR